MARPAGPKTRCNGQWTEAKYKSFIRGNLRRVTQKWAPIQTTLQKARVERGFYLCAHCEETVPATKKVDGKRVKNVHVDHIDPVIDPAVGWVSWDSLIERMFVEEDGLQVLCDECHTKKTNEEKAVAKQRRTGELFDE